MKRIEKLILVSLAGLCAGLLSLYAADEVKVTCQLDVTKGKLELERKPGRIEIDMAGDSISDIVQTITATSTDLVVVAAGVATNGVTWFRNLTTNTTWYVDIGRMDGTSWYPFMRLAAEEVSVGRLHPTNAIYAVSTGGNVLLRTIVVED